MVQVNQVLNKARDDAGNYAQNSLPDTNNVVRMVTAGSKGSFINISQACSCSPSLVKRSGSLQASAASADFRHNQDYSLGPNKCSVAGLNHMSTHASALCKYADCSLMCR